jgi:hypothetical protein
LKLDGWIPVRVSWREGGREPFLDWCLLGETRFTEPFFADTLERHLRHPFHHAFRRETPISALNESRLSGAPVKGIVFHMSRCGSTLVAQMLAALEQNIVLSEAEPVDAILRSHLREPSITEEQRIDWLRGIVNALGQRRSEREQNLFLKLDCWSIAELPLIARAFPETPWIFLYRDPLEVLASQFRSPGGWTIPAILPPGVLGLEQLASAVSWPEYRVRVVGRICELALPHRQTGRGLLINYSQLPEAVYSVLPDHFGVDYSSADLNRMREVSRQNAKIPAERFEPAALSLPPEARELAERWIYPVYEQLEALRVPAGVLR